MMKCQSSGRPDGLLESDQIWETPKKEPNLGPQNPFNDLLEDRLRIQSKVEGRRGSSSSSSSSCSSSIVGHLRSGGPSSTGSLDQWEHFGGSSGRSSRVSGAFVPALGDTPHRCESPDLGYTCSLVKAYSSLSLVVPQSPDHFFPADLRAGSQLSDCSSEGSVSSDSFSPDPSLDDVPKCHHHHHHYPHHHRCSGQYASSATLVPPGLGQHSPLHHPIPQALRRTRNFGSNDCPSSGTPDPSPRAFKNPLAYSTPQPLNLTSFSGDFQTFPHRQPQASATYSLPQSSPLRSSGMGSSWQDGVLQDSQMHKGSPLSLRRNHHYLDPQPHHQTNWESHYQQSPKPYYDLLTLQNHPDANEKVWPSPWGRQPHFSPRGLSASSPSPLPQLSLSSSSVTHRGHIASRPRHQEPPTLGQYHELREGIFVNLSRIFSPDLVRTVMTRNPHVMDAEELAAAILIEKSQHGSWKMKPFIKIPNCFELYSCPQVFTARPQVVTPPDGHSDDQKHKTRSF